MIQFRFHLVLINFASVSAALHADERQIRVVTDSENRPIAVEAVGWPKDELTAVTKSRDIEYLAKMLSVYVVNEKGEIQLPEISGRREIINAAVRFTPQFALRPGTKYQAHSFYQARLPIASPAARKLDFKIPARTPAEPTRVTAIYPSASTLPENQLRFYIHFSAPMAAGHAYEHVKLLKANGEVVSRAFLEIGEELWDGSGQRLTLLFDPGRVKKGLSPRAQF